jgi:hypothetical protein
MRASGRGYEMRSVRIVGEGKCGAAAKSDVTQSPIFCGIHVHKTSPLDSSLFPKYLF